MLVGLCELFLYLPDCHSLKDKRSVLNNFKSLMRKKYNISITETGHKNAWKKSVIWICCISDSRQMIDRVMNRFIKEVEQYRPIQLIDFQITIN